jgi:hypothetical protein
MTIRPSFEYWRFSAARARGSRVAVSAPALVDVERHLVQLRHALGERRPFVIVQLPGAHLVAVDVRDRGEHPAHQLRAAHLHREDDTGRPLSTATCSAMFSASAVFPMLGRAGDDDQVPRLQAGGLLVEARSRSARRSRRSCCRGGRGGRCARRPWRAAASPRPGPRRGARRLGDLEDLRLGLVEQHPTSPPPGESAVSAISVATCARRRCIDFSRTSSA